MALPDCRCVASLPPWKALGSIIAAARTWAGESPDQQCFENRPIIDQLNAWYCATLNATGGGGGGGATLLASFYIPEIVDDFTRPIAAGYSGNGDPSPWQREDAVDVLRDDDYQGGFQLVLLENDPTPCQLVAPGQPDVTPGEEVFSAEWTAIPITVSLQKYQYQIDSDGWVDNGTNLTLTNISASAGNHFLSVRAVSTSGVAGDIAISDEFEVTAGPELFDLVTVDGLGANQNDFTGKVGFRFTATADITLREIGRWKIVGNTQVHTLRVYNFSGTQLATTSVDMSTGAANDFIYGTLNVTVAMANGATYYIMSDETNGGDQFKQESTTITLSSEGSTPVAVYNDGTFHDGSGETYGPLGVRYTIP